MREPKNTYFPSPPLSYSHSVPVLRKAPLPSSIEFPYNTHTPYIPTTKRTCCGCAAIHTKKYRATTTPRATKNADLPTLAPTDTQTTPPHPLSRSNRTNFHSIKNQHPSIFVRSSNCLSRMQASHLKPFRTQVRLPPRNPPQGASLGTPQMFPGSQPAKPSNKTNGQALLPRDCLPAAESGEEGLI